MMPVVIAIGAVAQLVNTILEGISVDQRRAVALQWFHLWWPVGKVLLAGKPEVIAQIEDIMLPKVKP